MSVFKVILSWQDLTAKEFEEMLLMLLMTGSICSVGTVGCYTYTINTLVTGFCEMTEPGEGVPDVLLAHMRPAPELKGGSLPRVRAPPAVRPLSACLLPVPCPSRRHTARSVQGRKVANCNPFYRHVYVLRNCVTWIRGLGPSTFKVKAVSRDQIRRVAAVQVSTLSELQVRRPARVCVGVAQRTMLAYPGRPRDLCMQGRLIFQDMALNGTRRTHFEFWTWGNVCLIKVPLVAGKDGKLEIGHPADRGVKVCRAGSLVVSTNVEQARIQDVMKP